jgi:hypothetical protein
MSQTWTGENKNPAPGPPSVFVERRAELVRWILPQFTPQFPNLFALGHCVLV